ncbi:MAG TPA: sigma-70 family RNA polymerase sigma factor [Candidatus Saccharimonadales bacterium]|nr:sigma-70 family RNA polymerase sigma factor [Candidatus Saccharimonadales bacterium]
MFEQQNRDLSPGNEAAYLLPIPPDGTAPNMAHTPDAAGAVVLPAAAVALSKTAIIEADTPQAAADGELFNLDGQEEASAEDTLQTADTYSGARSVKAYLNKIGKISRITTEQEVELAKRIEAGASAAERLASAEKRKDLQVDDQLKNDLSRRVRDGNQAKKDLIEANLRLVVSIANRYTGRGMEFLDLIQEGNVGLYKAAAEEFDYARGNKFSTCATWWIRQAITRAIAAQARTIRIPEYKVTAINALHRTQRQMAQTLGREPTAAELAIEMDMTPEKLSEIIQDAREPISYQQPIGHDSDAQLGDFIPDPDQDVHKQTVKRQLPGAIENALDTLLSDREADIVRKYFGLGGQQMSLAEIGAEYGVTRQGISVTKIAAMKKLSSAVAKAQLEAYVD